VEGVGVVKRQVGQWHPILPLSMAGAWIAFLVAIDLHSHTWRYYGLIGFIGILLMPWTIASVRGKRIDFVAP
jgi:hypothetical protein